METNISVVIPTYRRPDLLRRCIAHLVQQKIKIGYEIIVVVDDREDIAPYRDLPASVRVYCLGTHRGPAAARNFGVTKAHGELIIFTDDDCIPDENFLNGFWRTYRFTDVKLLAMSGRVKVPIPASPTDYEKNISRLETAEFVTASCAVSRQAFDLVGGFDELYTMAWREDSDLHFKLIIYGVPIAFAPDAIVVHPVRSAKWNVALSGERKNMFNSLLYKKFPQLYETKIRSKPPASYYWMVGLFTAGMMLIFFGYTLAGILMAAWFLAVVLFSLKRLRDTSRRPEHIAEIIVTSMVIPFLSIYWNVYGNIKFKSKLV